MFSPLDTNPHSPSSPHSSSHTQDNTLENALQLLLSSQQALLQHAEQMEQRLHETQQVMLALHRQIQGLRTHQQIQEDVARYLSSTWYPLFLNAQDCIESHQPNPYYKTYKRHELSYWPSIPKWIQQQYKQHQSDENNTPLDVIDLAAGYGTLLCYTKQLGPTNLFGTDFYPSIQPGLIESQAIQFQQVNLELAPLPFKGPFDMVIFTEVLEHFNFNPLPTLQKIREILKPAGKLYLSTPDGSSWGRLPHYASWRDMPQADTVFQKLHDDHIYQFEEAELLELIQEAGLQVDRMDYSFSEGGRHFNLQLSRA